MIKRRNEYKFILIHRKKEKQLFCTASSGLFFPFSLSYEMIHNLQSMTILIHVSTNLFLNSFMIIMGLIEV